MNDEVALLEAPSTSSGGGAVISLSDIHGHILNLQQQVDSWTRNQVSVPHATSAPSQVSFSTWLWYLAQGATLLGTCLAIAAWIWWKQFGQRWWYIQDQRNSQIIEDMSNEDLHRLLGGKHLPSWVNFPDFQRVEWVNDVVGQLWPKVNAVATKRFHEFADPLIQQSKPSWVYHVEMQKCTFGDVPPRVDAVKIYKNVGPDDQVVMEYNFHWAGKQQMEMLMQPLPPTWGRYSPSTVAQWASSLFRCKVAVEDIIADGRLRLAVTPVLDESQLAAALQISLVEMPSFSFNIHVYGGDITFLPGVEKWINWFIETRVLRPYVLPERLTVPVKFLYDPTLQTDNNWAEKPKGMLFVRLISAHNVPRMDWFKLSRSDPYVELYTRHGRKLKSQVKHTTTTPEWNEDFRFLVHVPGQQYLNGVLKDWDRLSASDEIGRFKYAISELEPGVEKDVWLEVEASDHKKHIRNHSEFHEHLDEKKGGHTQRASETKNDKADPPMVATPSDRPSFQRGQPPPGRQSPYFADDLDSAAQDGEAAFYDAGPEAVQEAPEARHQAPPDAVAHEAAREVAYDRIQWGRMSPLPGEDDHQRTSTSSASSPQIGGSGGRRRTATWPTEEVHQRNTPVSHSGYPLRGPGHPLLPEEEVRQAGNPLSHIRYPPRGTGHPWPEEEVRQAGTPLSLSGSPMGVTPRRGATSERSPLWKVRRRSRPQSWEASAEGVREQLGNFGAQLGIGPQPCKVHLKLTYHTFGSDELQALCEGDQQGGPGRGPPRELHTQDSEAVRFLKGGVLYVHLVKAIGMIAKPKYKGGFMTSRVTAKVMIGQQTKFSDMVKSKQHDQTFDQTWEFVLAADEVSERDSKLEIQLWDYKFRNHCLGLVAIPMMEVIHKKVVNDTFQLDAAKHGQLQLQLRWMSILQGA